MTQQRSTVRTRTARNEEVIEGAAVEGNIVNRDTDFLPNPELAQPEAAAKDRVLYEAWRDYMIAGFDQNKVMFKRVLNAFMRPYGITVAMYVMLFLIGAGGIITAAILAVTQNVVPSLIFGGLSVVTFLTFFVSQPLRALEQNLLFITWLGVVYNTYWTKLMYTSNLDTVQQDLEVIQRNTIAELNRLVDKHEKLARRRPGAKLEAEQPTTSAPPEG